MGDFTLMRNSPLSEAKFEGSLHEARWHGAYDLPKRRIIDVPVDRVSAEKLCVIKSVEGLKTEFHRFGLRKSCVF